MERLDIYIWNIQAIYYVLLGVNMYTINLCCSILATCGYQATEIWLVRIEVCYKCKKKPSDKEKYVKYLIKNVYIDYMLNFIFLVYWVK